MPSTFQMPKAAFAPFFDTPVAFAATRPDGVHSGTVPASFFDEGLANVIDEETGTSTKIQEINLLVRKRDWSAAISSSPQSGDKFSSPFSGRKYAVMTVNHFGSDVWSILAREVS